MTRGQRLLRFAIGSILFALAYTQAPLYYSNQNQYFLHGLAAAGQGHLDRDWLANTVSPTPVFDAIVTNTAKYGHETLFYAYYAVLLGLYFSSLMGLFDYLAGERGTPGKRLAFAAMLFLVHAAILRWASYQLFDTDYPCYAQGWLAAQYVLGPVFQPSTFGVFLLVAIERFVRQRYFIAFTAVAIAGIGHSTYLLPGAILTIAFAGVLIRERQRRKAVALSLWTLALVLPGVIHAFGNFRPTTPEAFAEAEYILAHIRIPHHCDPARWCDAITWVQVGVMLAGIAWTWRTRLFPILLALFATSAVLTAVQLAAGNDTLALLFPWRCSVILLPVATTVLLAHLILKLPIRWESGFAKWGSRITIAVCCVAGAAIMMFQGGYASNDAEEPLMAFVRSNLRPGDCYLLPVSLPNAQGSKGSISSDFKPLPAQQADKRLIPLDFQRFRLATGAPIYIDFKAIPYKDVEVLEWFRRVKWNQSLYAAKNWNDGTLAEIKAAGITHVVVSKSGDMSGDGLLTVYEDENYKVYRVVE